MSIKLYPENLLIYATVDVQGSTEDPDFPESRLYDQSIAFFWVSDSTAQKTIHIDFGATDTPYTDILIIDRHNFDGATINWQWSDNDADWTDAVTSWAQSGNGQIARDLTTPLQHRYWRLVVSVISENHKSSEVFMGLGYEFALMASPVPIETETENVQWNRTVGGMERSTKFGKAKRNRRYSLQLDTAKLAEFKAFLLLLDDFSRPFYLFDHEGKYWLARFLNNPLKSLTDGDLARTTLDLLEIL